TTTPRRLRRGGLLTLGALRVERDGVCSHLHLGASLALHLIRADAGHATVDGQLPAEVGHALGKVGSLIAPGGHVVPSSGPCVLPLALVVLPAGRVCDREAEHGLAGPRRPDLP